MSENYFLRLIYKAISWDIIVGNTTKYRLLVHCDFKSFSWTQQLDFEWRVQFEMYWEQNKNWSKKNEMDTKLKTS